jgi:hypothetical protein
MCRTLYGEVCSKLTTFKTGQCPIRHRARFPPPRTIDEANDACFIVRGKIGQALAYFGSISV